MYILCNYMVTVVKQTFRRSGLAKFYTMHMKPEHLN